MAAGGDPLDAIRAKMQQDPSYDPLKDPQAMQVLPASTHMILYHFTHSAFTSNPLARFDFDRESCSYAQMLEQQIPPELKEAANAVERLRVSC